MGATDRRRGGNVLFFIVLSSQELRFGIGGTAVEHTVSVDFQTACGKIGHSLRQQLVLHFQDACGDVVGRIAVENRHHALRNHGPAIEFGRNEMHRAAGHAAAGGQCAFVGVQAGKGGQQRGMDVDQAAFVMGAEGGREDAHKSGQHDQIGLMAVDQFHHGAVEGFAVGEVFVVQRGGIDAARCRPRQSGGVFVVAQYGADVRIRNGGFDDGLHIAAASGNQDDDVFHNGESDWER